MPDKADTPVFRRRAAWPSGVPATATAASAGAGTQQVQVQLFVGASAQSK